MRYRKDTPGVFLQRPNRFIAYCEIDGNVEKCHVKNTGRCREILVPGTTVYLVPGDNPARSTPYDLVAAQKGDLLINIDSQAPNKVAGEYIERILGPCDYVKPEYTLGDSRFDFYAEQGGRKVLMEVKGVTLENGLVMSFPDAPTERGLKHVKELTELVSQGYRCVVCFIIQADRARYMTPNYATHPEFGKALEEAEKKGVEVVSWTCFTAPGSLNLKEQVPVRLGHLDMT